MDSIKMQNLNFSGLRVQNKALNRLQSAMLRSMKKTDFIKNLSANQDVYLTFNDGLVPTVATLEIPNRGHVNLCFSRTKLRGVFEAIHEDIEKIPQQAFDALMTLNSKFSAKLSKAKSKCAEMNKTAIAYEYYPITPEKIIGVTPNLAISTKDVEIAQGIPGVKGAIDFIKID